VVAALPGQGRQERRHLDRRNGGRPHRQAKVDKNGDIWTGGMAVDRIARINSKTGDMVEYPLPANTNIRNLYVDDSTTPVSIWFGNNHGAAIVKLQPLD
jgi:streptogramin lyase